MIIQEKEKTKMEPKMTVTVDMFFSKAYEAEMQKIANKMIRKEHKSQKPQLYMIPASKFAVACAA